MIENRSAPPGAVVPVLVYDDVDKAIQWLRGAFGFEERFRTRPEADGTIHHAQVTIGEGAAILSGRRGYRPSTSAAIESLFIPVSEVDRHFDRAKAFGAKIVRPPASHEFGERQYTAEDLEGHLWTFSQSVANVDPETWGAIIRR